MAGTSVSRHDDDDDDDDDDDNDGDDDDDDDDDVDDDTDSDDDHNQFASLLCPHCCEFVYLRCFSACTFLQCFSAFTFCTWPIIQCVLLSGMCSSCIADILR